MIEKYSENVKRIINVAYEAYHGKKRDGIPYICYLINVADDYDDDVMVVWFLNNIMTNTGIPYKIIDDLEISKECKEAVRLLEYDGSVSIEEYVGRLKSNRLARIVKSHELRHMMKYEIKDDLEKIEELRKAREIIQNYMREEGKK
jgi:hypothetical protein